MKATILRLLFVFLIAISLSSVASIASARSITCCKCTPAYCDGCGHYVPAKKVCWKVHRHCKTVGGYCKCGVYYPKRTVCWYK